MKKLFLTSAILATMVCPTFADNITTTNNDCDNTTLTTYSGSAVLEADWSANTVNVTYYNGDNVYGEAGECTYDDTLTLPTAPSKDGYTFAGWTVKSMVFDITTLAQYASSRGTAYAFIKFDGTESTVSGSYQKAASTYNLSNNGEWAAEFSYGTIKGISLCSPTNGGKMGATGTPDETSGQYCWCKVTGYDEDKDGNYISPAASLWVFAYDYPGSSCASGCTAYCGSYAQSSAPLRVGLFRSSN